MVEKNVIAFTYHKMTRQSPRFPRTSAFVLVCSHAHTHRLSHSILHRHILNADAKCKRTGRIGDAIFKTQMDILNF